MAALRAEESREDSLAHKEGATCLSPLSRVTSRDSSHPGRERERAPGLTDESSRFVPQLCVMSLHDNSLFEPQLLHLWNGIIVLLAGYIAKIQEEVVFVGLLFFILHLQVLTYLLTRSLYLLATFTHFTHSPPSASGNQQPVLSLIFYF